MERTLIAPGVHLSCDPAEKFNRCRISIHFAFPAQRATATAHALLPLVLERGYAAADFGWGKDGLELVLRPV